MKTILLLAAAGLAGLPASLPAHEHLAVGAGADGRLQLYRGSGAAITDPTMAGVYHLCPRPAPQTFGGFYSLSDEDPRALYPNDSFAFVAYSDGQVQLDGSHHARTGTNIWCEITSVTGPPGGHFGFWDDGRESFYFTPTLAFATNAPTGGWKFSVSEPLSGPAAPPGALTEPPNYEHYLVPGSVGILKVDPGEDPFGHIHNRGFTADQPGDYLVGFTFHDLGGNGPGGGALHAASPTYYFHFQAGPDFTPRQTFSGADAVLTWPSLMGVANGQPGVLFTVQRSTDLTGWQTLGTVTGTTAATVSFTDPGALTRGRAFYRLQYPWSTSP